MSRLTRRNFLVGSVAGGVMMAFSGCSRETTAPTAPSETLAAGAFEPTVWFEVRPDGGVLVNIAKAEMGQHVGTALARVVAEELEADWDQVEILHVDSDPRWGYMVTGGSWSVHTTFDQLSAAGAAGRIALLEAGAALLGVSQESCSVSNSVVSGGGKSISFGDIVSSGTLDRSFSEEELAALPRKAPEQRKLLGRPVAALDIPAKTRGGAEYGIDAKIDGMVYARPVLPPTRYGCTIDAVDDSAAKTVPGYLETVPLEDPSGTCQGWLAVVAETFPAAIKAADALKVSWTPGPNAEVSESDILAEGEKLVNDPAAGGLWLRLGDVDAAMASADKVVDSTYRTSSVLHFQLEPVNALAFEKDGHWHLHAGNQWQSLYIPVVAEALGVAEEQVTFHQYYLGGGFGRRLSGDYMVPAALTAKAIGRPVKMVFTRPDDSRFDCLRSPSVQRVQTALDASGKPTAYDHAAAAGWPTAAMAPGFLSAPEEAGTTDRFSISGADHWYSIPSQRIRAIKNEVAQGTFQPGWLRAVGPGWTGWAVEQHMDEVAAAAGSDPLEFRLSLLDAAGRNSGEDPVSTGGAARLREALVRAADMAGWKDRDSLPADTGLGIAVSGGQERTMPTWTACVARVKVDRSSGKINVEKLTAVVDAGTIVDPDGALAQLEGSTLWGLSLALHESTEIASGEVSDTNLDTYTPLRIHQVPEMDLAFVDNTHMPSGLGEPGLIAVAPAIANAVHAAVGARLRDLPMRPERVLAALSA